MFVELVEFVSEFVVFAVAVVVAEVDDEDLVDFEEALCLVITGA